MKSVGFIDILNVFMLMLLSALAGVNLIKGSEGLAIFDLVAASFNGFALLYKLSIVNKYFKGA